LELALREADAGDRALRAQLHYDLAVITFLMGLPGLEEHATRAAELAEGVDDAFLHAEVVGLGLYVRSLHEEVDNASVEQVLSLEEEAGGWNARSPSLDFVMGLLAKSGRLEEARDVGGRMLELARRSGRYRTCTLALATLATVEIKLGDLDAAERHIAEHGELVGQIGETAVELDTLYLGTRLDALRGRVDEARAKARRCVDRALELGVVEAASNAYEDLARLELSLGNHSEAAHLLEQTYELFAEPLLHQRASGADYVEALVGSGRLDEAEARIEWLDCEGRATRQPLLVAAIARSRGLIVAARGDYEHAIALLQESVARHETLQRPFDLGRTLLMLGTVARRARKKRLARESLDRALEILEQLGAPIWAERARTELSQVGGRSPAALGRLTPTEERIAELVASGRSNAEVAQTLFVSPKTVEWNLSKIYKKLHVRSRGELAAKLAKQPAAKS
jgi:DNA-binding CsgD family transcriptional regulator